MQGFAILWITTLPPGRGERAEAILPALTLVKLAGVKLAGVKLAGVKLAGVKLAGVKLAGAGGCHDPSLRPTAGQSPRPISVESRY